MTASRHSDRLAALADGTFDLLVIGGGITGAGVARDAALRGLRTALVEREDFASGTSSRSSRLVHGGLRYLEHGHLHLVFEASAERRRLLRLAPHLVRPLAFTWPVYRGARIGRWKVEAGLFLYDALALFRNVGRHRRLSRGAVLAAEPRLRADALTGGARYWDAATDDARLTLAAALDAAALGATVVNHAEVRALVHERGRVSGAVVADTLPAGAGREVSVRARAVVDAAGPWGDAVRRLDDAAATAEVRGTKGTHIVVPRERIGNHAALTLLHPADGRVMFVLPAGTQSLVGTTDTPTDESPATVRASADDVRYLLDAANHFFPEASLREADVVSAWAGIRPLVASGYGAGPAAASREHAVHRSASGLISISGGKLTTFRVMAADTVDAVERALGRSPTPAPTADRPLPGGDIASLESEIAAAAAAVGARGAGHATAEHLVESYGSAWRRVWALATASPELAEPLAPGLPYLVAELPYAIEHERALTLGDLLLRRTHVAFEARDHGREAARAALPLVAATLGWTADDCAMAMEDYEKEVARVFE